MFTGAFQRFLIVVLTNFWLCPDGGSQTQVNYLQPGFDCFSANLFKVNEDTMMLFGVTGRPGNQSTAYAYIEYFGSDGEHIGTRKLTELLNSHLDEFKILPLTNGKIVTIPVIHSCDYYPGIKVGVIDPSFGYQWIADTYMHYDKDFFVSQIGLNAFCLFNDSREQCFDLDGNMYWPVDPPWNIGPKIPHHHGFLASDGSVLYQLDSTFSPDHAIWLKQPIRDFTVSDTFGLIALTTDSVFVIDSSLSITLSAPAEIINPKFITSVNNSICIGNETTVVRLDPSLTLLETWTLPGFVRITDINANNNTVFIAGIDISNPMHTAALCITTPVDSFYLNTEEDVQITSIRIDGQAKYKHVGQDGESIYSVDYGPVFCTLRNNGPDTVRSVAIRHQREVVSWICGNYTRRYIRYLQEGTAIRNRLGEIEFA